LPRLSIDIAQPIDGLSSIFPKPVSEVWLEIGFGGGEHLAAEARAFPAKGFIGCEVFLNGIAQALSRIEEQGIKNIRFYKGDARHFIGSLPAASLDGVYLLYPDPWPKRRHWRRRFLSLEMLARLARVMKSSAELRFATDIDDNAGWTLLQILNSPHFTWRAESPEDWRRPWAGWGGTRYEAKALRQGRRPAYLTFVRN